MTETGESVLAEFFRGNYQRLVDFVRSMLQDSAEKSGEDIVQDVMLSLLQRPDLFDTVTNLSGYVFRSLKNRVIDHYRKNREETLSLDSRDEDGLNLFDMLPDITYQPEDAYHRESLRKLLIRLIGELPRNQMEVIVETEFNEKTYSQLSREWNVPTGTLLARKHRGVKAIRQKLEKIQEV
ncbi:MAG: sigma-70 family RNA polymerase sigma factor [Candidatus Aegiribacteria sp.]|nr:sigma-70 family RNA polymerase sigma factor [Candidatus Aegiribacteria sp.]MBD3294686.1 sigma-70 family RNA polymerase sigma factor [Candidatus Fermentibacteria bacterium]